MTELQTLTADESLAFARAESLIEKHLQTFKQVAEALQTIRDGRLYRTNYDTFEEYCQGRWEFTRQRAYQIINAGEVVDNIETKRVTVDPAQMDLAYIPTEGEAVEFMHPIGVVNEGAFVRDTGSAYVVRVKIEDDGTLGPDVMIPKSQLIGPVKIEPGPNTVPRTERQARELAKLDPDDQADAWKEAQALSGVEQPSAAVVRSVVNQRLNPAGENEDEDDEKTLDRDSYSTADYIIDFARNVMGSIDFDPATNERAQGEVVRAEEYYTKHSPDKGGLGAVWWGNVWLNPPYSGELCRDYARKFAAEMERGYITAAMVLINSATDTEMYHTFAALAGFIVIPRGRLQFWHPDFDAADKNRYAQTIFVYGDVDEAYMRTWASDRNWLVFYHEDGH